MLAIVIKGAYDLGGHSVVWEIADQGGRIEFFKYELRLWIVCNAWHKLCTLWKIFYFSFDFDPRTRHTVWSLVIGGYFTWIAIYGVNQAQVIIEKLPIYKNYSLLMLQETTQHTLKLRRTAINENSLHRRKYLYYNRSNGISLYPQCVKLKSK